MNIITTRFGNIEVKESEFITMHGSILGFENLRHFVLLAGEENTPFWWFQSIQEPAVAFVVINPQIVKTDYNPVISKDDIDFLDIKKNDDMALLAIITIRANSTRITANLRAPILINAATKKANQIILADPEYPIQYDILGNKANLNKCLTDDTQKVAGMAKLSDAVAAV